MVHSYNVHGLPTVGQSPAGLFVSIEWETVISHVTTHLTHVACKMATLFGNQCHLKRHTFRKDFDSLAWNFRITQPQV